MGRIGTLTIFPGGVLASIKDRFHDRQVLSPNGGATIVGI